jgi:hypothetical protein
MRRRTDRNLATRQGKPDDEAQRLGFAIHTKLVKRP